MGSWLMGNECTSSRIFWTWPEGEVARFFQMWELREKSTGLRHKETQ